MTALATLMNDASTKVKAATTLDSRAGLAAMHFTDPTMRNAPRPCAWVIYGGMSNSSPDTRGIPGGIDATYEIIVKVLLAYNTEADLKAAQYPVLDDIRDAMTSTPVSAIKGCEYFKFEAETLEELDDRLVYVQRYSIKGTA